MLPGPYLPAQGDEAGVHGRIQQIAQRRRCPLPTAAGGDAAQVQVTGQAAQSFAGQVPPVHLGNDGRAVGVRFDAAVGAAPAERV